MLIHACRESGDGGYGATGHAHLRGACMGWLPHSLVT